MSRYFLVLAFLISQAQALPLGSRWPQIYLGVSSSSDLLVTCADTMSLPMELAQKIQALDKSCDALYSDDKKFCNCFRDSNGFRRHAMLMEKVVQEKPRLDALYRQMLHMNLEGNSRELTETLLGEIAKADLLAEKAGLGERACYKKFMGIVATNESFYYAKTPLSHFYEKHLNSSRYKDQKREIAESSEVVGDLGLDDFCEVPATQMFNVMNRANDSEYNIRDVFSIDAENREAAIVGLQRLQDFLKEDPNSQSLMNAYYCFNYETAMSDHVIASNEEKMMREDEIEDARNVIQDWRTSEANLRDVELEAKNVEVALKAAITRIDNIGEQLNRVDDVLNSRTSTTSEKEQAQKDKIALNKEFRDAIAQKVALFKEFSLLDERVKTARNDLRDRRRRVDALRVSEAFINTQRDRMNADSSSIAFSNSDGRVIKNMDYTSSVITVEKNNAGIGPSYSSSSYGSDSTQNKEKVVSNDVFSDNSALLSNAMTPNTSYLNANIPVASDGNFVKVNAADSFQVESTADIIREGVGQINEAAQEQRRLQEERNAQRIALEKEAEEKKNSKNAFDLFNESNSKITALEARLAQLEKEKKELEKQARASRTENEVARSSQNTRAQSPFRSIGSSNNERASTSNQISSDSGARGSEQNISRSIASAPSSSSSAMSSSAPSVASTSYSARNTASASGALSLTEVKATDIKSVPKSLVMSVDQNFMNMTPTEQEVYLDGLVGEHEFIFVKFPDGKIVKVEGKDDARHGNENSRSIANVEDEKADILRQIERARQRHADLKALMNEAKIEK